MQEQPHRGLKSLNLKFEDGAFGSHNRIVRELYQKCFNNYNVKTIFIRGIR